MTSLDKKPRAPSGISAARAAFDRGDYAAVRQLATPFLTDTDPELKAIAADLLNRISPAPLSKYLLLVTCLLLLVVTWFAYAH